ncbi:MAG: chemotaxis protein CheW, partial [Pyrinomonadaceae bacterium]
FDKIPYDLRARLLVVSSEGRTIGLIVDTAREFVRIPAASIEPPPEAITGLSGKYLEGIATIDGRMILVLDLKEVIGIGDLHAEAVVVGRNSPDVKRPGD